MNSWWIREVRILDPLTQYDQIGDVLIKDQTIQALGSPLEASGELIQEIDGQGCVMGPGLVDLYSQTGEPGYESRETLEQFLQAASAGGFTQLGLLPNTTPAIDNLTQVKQRLVQKSGLPRVLPWGAITLGTAGKKLTDLMELSDSGVVGFCDGRPLENPRILQKSLEYMQPLPLPLAFWPCDPQQSGSCRDGADSVRLGLSPIANTAETRPLTALLEEVAVSRRSVHLMRISTARSVDLIRAAKNQGLPITASVTWLHLLFSTADLDSYAPSLKLAPPLGTPTDQAALIRGLEDGTIDAIAVDHCAHTYEEKAVPFGTAPPGAIGLPLVLPILWRTFVAGGRWSPLQLWSYLSSQPAQCLGIQTPMLKQQTPVNLVLFDPNQTWQATLHNLGSAPINTIYGEQIIQGKVKRIWI
ncbi:MAG: dihydroorotase [Cyanobacteria bacterium P01_D01_bin.156]